MLKQKIKNENGFTLLEALVAISILMVAVSAPITIAQKGLSSAVYSKDQMIASYLAQDAIEYIKNKRDEITINDQYFDWGNLSELNDCLEKTCEIDTIHPDVWEGENIRDSVNGKMNIDTNGFYGYEGVTTTKFTREILITPIPDADDFNEALVTATVRWGEDSNYVEIKTKIYNF